MTLRIYAARKNWPLDDVSVTLRHEKRHNQDSDDSDNPSAKLDYIERDISLSGALDEAQIARLLEIADKCSVHKSLEAGVVVHTAYKPAIAD